MSYNGLANAILCTAMNDGVGGNRIFAVAAAGCSNDWTSWWIGSRTQWNVTKEFYLGVDIAYQKLNSMTTSTGL